MTDVPFSLEQQNYLQGFVAGADAARSLRGLPSFASTLGIAPTEVNAPPRSSDSGTRPAAAEDLHRAMQDRLLAEGGKLTPEERAKRGQNPFEMWDEMRANAAAEKFPKGTDVFLYKFHGLFFVAPTQNAFMCRLRFAGGLTKCAPVSRSRRPGRDVWRRVRRYHDARQPPDSRDPSPPRVGRRQRTPRPGDRQSRRRGRQHPQRHRVADGGNRSPRTDRHATAGPGDASLHPESPGNVRVTAEVQHRLRRRRRRRRARRHQRCRLHGGAHGTGTDAGDR